MQVDDPSKAFELISHGMAEVRAEALAGRMMIAVLLQWMMQTMPNSAAAFDAISAAIDKGADELKFLVTDGGEPEDGVLDERVREMARTYCHDILQTAYKPR